MHVNINIVDKRGSKSRRIVHFCGFCGPLVYDFSQVCPCICSNVYLFFGNTFFSKSTYQVLQVKKVPRGSKWIAEFWNLGEIHILRKMSEKVKNGPQNRVFQFRLKMVENESSCGLFFSCGSFLWFFWFNENQDPEKFLVANQIKVFFDPQYL